MDKRLLNIDLATKPFSLGAKALGGRKISCGGFEIGTLRGPFRRPNGLSLSGEFTIGSDANAQRVIDAFWMWFSQHVDQLPGQRATPRQRTFRALASPAAPEMVRA